MRRFLILSFLCFSQFLLAQKQSSSFQLLDAHTGQGIPAARLYLYYESDTIAELSDAEGKVYWQKEPLAFQVKHVAYALYYKEGVKNGALYFLVPKQDQLEEVVVTGQSQPTLNRQAVRQVRVIDQKRIQQQAAVNLGDLLQKDLNFQVSEDGGANWRKISEFPGVPANTYVNQVLADLYDENTVYALFNNHKNGDFKPYVLKSTDKGNTWTNMTGDLPERGSVFAMRQDHVNKDLFFIGTEFGVHTTVNSGQKWRKLGAGLPTIAVRDLEIQRRENDLVLATFGRGFYVLDDYTPLRELKEEDLQNEAHLFPIKDATIFFQASPLGYGKNGFMGASYYNAPNAKNEAC
ncbi:MAG: hypothetical protein ACE37D_20250, partial [Pseudomonadales bacterium]